MPLIPGVLGFRAGGGEPFAGSADLAVDRVVAVVADVGAVVAVVAEPAVVAVVQPDSVVAEVD